MVTADPVTWWLSGLMTWMIPMNGKPSPHGIIYGQWEPTEVEADYGITDGFGAVSALLYGADQCGMAGHPVANARQDIFEGIVAVIDATNEQEGTNDWFVADAIYDWEENGCASSAREEFPWWGDYSSIPQFVTFSVAVVDWDGVSTGFESYDTRCWIVDEMTDYIVWKRDAYRQCVFDSLAP